MNHQRITALQQASTVKLTERLSRLSLETHTISRILVKRNNKTSIEPSTTFENRGDTTKDKNRIDRNRNILEIGDRVKVLKK